MKRRFKNVVVVTTLALTASASINANACDRGGRRISISRSPFGAPIAPLKRYTQTTYSQPAYSPSSYPQTVYSQNQLGYQQPLQALPSSQVSSVASQNRLPINNNVPVQRNVQLSNGVGIQGQPNLSTPPGQSLTASPTQQRVANTQQRVATPQRAASLAPSSNAAGGTTTAPAANQTPASQASAEASALQLLASMMTTSEPATDTANTAATAQNIPEFAPSESNADPEHVGTWNVNLPGDQSVELVLSADGNFTWTATKKGKSSNFQGQYRLENDRLTLVRSNDLQQMAGSWTVSGEGFAFKLDGATTGGLAFTRS